MNAWEILKFFYFVFYYSVRSGVESEERMENLYTEQKSSSKFTELFQDSQVQAIREQSVAQFLKLLADDAERFRNNSKKFCNF